MLRAPLPLLALALVSAGCLGANVDPAAVSPDALPAAAPLVTATAEWSAEGGADPVPVGEPVTLPAGADVLFLDYQVMLSRADASFELRAVAPDGKEHVIAGLGGGLFPMPTSRASWTILSAMPGEWSFVVVSDAASEGTLNVAASAKRALDARPAGTGADRVVVAIVDTGVNPYHEVFQRPDLQAGALPARIVEAETGLAPLVVPLARDADLLATLRLDAGVWAAVPGQTLVHFEGTNVLGYEVDETELPALPVFDRAGHGTAVSHAVTRENADVLVVMITASDYDAAVRWAASQPWIDVLSMSWGPAVNAAGPAFSAIGAFATPEATREVYDAGKVAFGASGNDPTPTFTDTTSGPIWVHAVSGSLADKGARATLSGNFVDTVANWTQELASYDSLDEVHMTSGTSFATPTTAGVASRILHEVRLRAGHEGGIRDGALVSAGDITVTNGDLRDALNATAFYFDTAGFQPDPDAHPVAPAPWVSMGWGQVDGSIVPLAVDVLLGEAEAPVKPAPANAWMDGWAQARQGFWP